MADVSVRPARVDDAPALAAVQLAAWRAGYGDRLPAQAYDPSAAATAWQEAVLRPPSPRYRVLAALAGDALVGLAAVGPADDEDRDPDDGELLAFAVDPGHRGRGHGSRLLAAAVDELRSRGTVVVVAWVDALDEPLRAFLAAAGWQPDGSHRTLRTSEDDPPESAVRQVRLHVDLTEESA